MLHRHGLNGERTAKNMRLRTTGKNKENDSAKHQNQRNQRNQQPGQIIKSNNIVIKFEQGWCSSQSKTISWLAEEILKTSHPFAPFFTCFAKPPVTSHEPATSQCQMKQIHSKITTMFVISLISTLWYRVAHRYDSNLLEIWYCAFDESGFGRFCVFSF